MKYSNALFKRISFITILAGLGSIHAPLFAQTNILENETPTNLNDRDRITSETFLHAGKAQRIYDENCKKDEKSKQACAGSDAETKFLGMDSTLIEGVSKAYSLILGMGGLGGTLEGRPEGGETPGTANVENEAKPVDDYCRYIPMGSEAVALFQQQKSQTFISQIPSTADSIQIDTLRKAKISHQERAKTAKIQWIGWGATSVCYMGMMTPGLGGASLSSWKNWLKMGAATLLTGHFIQRESDHQDYADKVQSIIDKMPGKGDCNPITEKACYCSEESTKNDIQNCQKAPHQNKVATNSLATSCISESLQADPACTCQKSNSCFGQKLVSELDLLGIPPGFVKQNMADYVSLTTGELAGGKLTGGGDRLFSMIQKGLREGTKDLDFENIKPNKKQKAQADAIAKIGLPLPLAAKIAAITLSAQEKKNIAQFQKSLGQDLVKDEKKGENNSSQYTQGPSPSDSKVKDNEFDFLKSLNKNKSQNKKKGAKIFSYAEKAQRRAEINRDTGMRIFDIITRRYQVSGWDRLDLFE